MNELDRPPLQPFPRDAPEPGTVWKHYRGGFYQVVAMARHSETLEHLVVYVLTKDDEKPRKVWCRPLGMWADTAIVRDGATVPRFRRVR